MSVTGVFGATAAHAEGGNGITSTEWLHNGGPLQEGAEVKDSDSLGVYFTADPSASGQEVTFTFKSPVEVPASITNNIDFVESITTDPGTGEVTVNFGDITDQSVEGSFEFSFQYDANTGEQDLTFQIDGQERTVKVTVITKGDDKFTGETGLVKTSNRGTIDGYVELDDAGNPTLKESVKELAFNYIVRVVYDGSGEQPAHRIVDVLPDGMKYDEGSFDVKVRTWDSNGYNVETSQKNSNPTIDSGDPQSFTYDFASELGETEGPWELTLTYTAHLTGDAAIFAIEEELAKSFENIESGNYQSEERRNTARVGELESSAPFNFRGHQPKGPGVGGEDFAKHVENWNWNLLTEIDDDGNLADPLPVTYRLEVNWANWDEGSKGQDIIVTDQLPTGVEWDEGATDFLSWGVISGSNNADQDLEKVEPCEVVSVGEYCTDGQELVMNLGSANDIASAEANESATKAYIYLKANVVKVNPEEANEQASGLTHFSLENKATFTVGTNGPNEKSAWITVETRGDDPVEDKSLFSKEGKAESETAEVGGTVLFDYTLTVNAGAGVDATQSYIIDYIDPIPEDLFDLDEDLENVTITMRYDGQNLKDSDFQATLNEDGDIRIELTDAGKAKVGDNLDKTWVTDIELETRELRGDDGRETVEVTNRASVFGEDGESYKDSAGTSKSTSYGNGLELAKRVFDCEADADAGENPWKQSVTAWIGKDGELVNDTFIFRLEVLPHGTYGQTGMVTSAAINFDDEFPEGLNFEGFVKPDELDCDPGIVDGFDLPGNLTVTPLDNNNGVNVTVKDGERFQPNAGPFYVYIAASVDEEALDEVSLTNVFGKSEARVDIKEPSIVLEKWTEEDGSEGPIFDEDGNLTNDGDYLGDFDDEAKTLIPEEEQTIFFTVSNDGEENLVDLNVTDEIVEGGGEISELACDYPEDGILRPGERFTCEATFSGIAAGETHKNTAEVTAVGEESGIPVNDTDEWNAKTEESFAIGDYVWIDSNRDGIQDDDEEPLESVTVTLADSAGNPVTDVYGNDIRPTATDSEGRYIFDNLPAGEYKVHFELTEKQAKKYIFTTLKTGNDESSNDSDADPATGWTEDFVLNVDTPALTVDYIDQDFSASEGIDPTWDAGVVEKSYAIGDYVWIDSNRDGIQDEGEDPLPGVTVELFDSEGDLVDSTTSDDEGRYLFDNLPAGEYKVKFTLTDEQAAIYDFTTLNTGNSESTNDSDADPATGWTTVIVLDDSNTSLTGEYDRAIEASEGVDPTWDAGVVLKPLTPEEGPGPDPTPEQTPDPEPTPEGEDIPSLGAEFNGTLVGIAVALLLAGAATVALVRRES